MEILAMGKVVVPVKVENFRDLFNAEQGQISRDQVGIYDAVRLTIQGREYPSTWPRFPMIARS